MSEPIQAALAALRESIAQFPAAPAPPLPLQATRTGQALDAQQTADDELRWVEIDRRLDGQLAGRRVLVVGSPVAYDASAFAMRGAAHVLACEPPDAATPIRRWAPEEGSNIDVQRVPWRSLDAARDGTFDLVHCNGLLHRVLEPFELLCALRRMMTPEGTLLIGSTVLADPERSEYLRFIPDRYAGDSTWWFVPGRLAFRWLVQTAGFEIEDSFGERERPRDELQLITEYLRASAPAPPGSDPPRH